MLTKEKEHAVRPRGRVAPRRAAAPRQIGMAEYLRCLYPPGTKGELVAYVKEPFLRRFGTAGDLEGFAQRIHQLDGQGLDVYLTINTLDGEAIRGRGGLTRGKESEVVSVVGLVADIDAEKPGHNYPPQARILEVLDEMPLQPTMVVLSGKVDGGLHVYWLFDRPIRIQDDAHRARIKAASVGWQKLLKAKLAPFSMDSTADLVRVLRPVGTTNHKYGSTVSCLQFAPEVRHALDDFERYIPKPEPATAPSRKTLPKLGLWDDNRVERAARYLAKIPPAISGSDGHKHTFHAACVLVINFDLTPDQAYPLLAEWNLGCQPPWSERELRHKLDDANQIAGERGSLLNDRTQTGHGVDLTDLVVEPYVEPAGEVRTLDEWRAEMVQNRLDTINKAGIFVDCSPTGSGKSIADRPAMRLAGTSLTLLPDHANCQELVESLKADGFEDVAAYPQIVEDKCLDFAAVTLARNLGLQATAAVCTNCNRCTHLQDMQAAKKSPHTIACHERAARSMLTVAAGKAFIAVHENAAGLLRPIVSFNRGLEATGQAAYDARQKLLDYAPRTKLDLELAEFLGCMNDVAQELRDKLRDATETIRLPVRPKMPQRPKQLDLKLFKALRQLPPNETLPPPETMRAMIAITAGEVDSVIIEVASFKGKEGVDKISKRIVVTWRTELPVNVPVWFSDATVDPESISDMADRPVEDRTPRGRLPMVQPVVQIPLDITRATSRDVVAARLRGVLHKHPEARSVGVIGHSVHTKKLFDPERPLFDRKSLGKIVKIAHFGQGQERASNEWQEVCDLIVVLGTPRVPVAAVRDHLLRRGKDSEGDGQWGGRVWQGRTVDGQPQVVVGLGYADPDWKAAHADLVQAELLQCIGRGRPILDGGVPVIVVSTEPLGVALGDALTRISGTMLRVVQAVETLSNDGGASTVAVGAAVGVKVWQARNLLHEAARLGLITKTKGHHGWKPRTTQSTQSTNSVSVISPNSILLGKITKTDRAILVNRANLPPNLPGGLVEPPGGADSLVPDAPSPVPDAASLVPDAASLVPEGTSPAPDAFSLADPRKVTVKRLAGAVPGVITADQMVTNESPLCSTEVF